MAKELGGNVAFVTGSGRGLGRAMAERLAELGADVAIHDLDWTAPAKYGEAADLGEVAKAIDKYGVRTAAVTGNIGDPAAVAKMRTDIEAKLGPVEILVNCAGGDIGASGGKPVPNNALDIPIEDVQALVNNNLVGTIIVCKTFVVPMRERGHGTVINLASAAAHLGVSDGAIYAMLKAAVAHYTRCLAKELMNDGVRVNAVSPGPDQNRPLPGDANGRSGQDGFQHQILRSLRRAGRDRRRGRVPRRAARNSSTARCCGSTAASRFFRVELP